MVKYYDDLNVGDVIKVIDFIVKEGMRGVEFYVNFRMRIIKNLEDLCVEEIFLFEEVRSYNYCRV